MVACGSLVTAKTYMRFSNAVLRCHLTTHYMYVQVYQALVAQSDDQVHCATVRAAGLNTSWIIVYSVNRILAAALGAGTRKT